MKEPKAHSIITETVPVLAGVPAIYDERLIGLEFSTKIDRTRDDIDSFWSGIYYVALSNNERRVLGGRNMFLQDVIVYPSDYDLRDESVGVVLSSTVSCDHRTRHVYGPSVAL